jgi:hypothetical protein
VKRLDDGVCAATTNFGHEPRQQAASEAAERRQDQKDRRPELVAVGGNESLAVRAQWHVACQVFEEKPLQVLETREKRASDQPGSEPHERRMEHHCPDEPQVERRALGKHDR